jgi:hypothetical protein
MFTSLWVQSSSTQKQQSRHRLAQQWVCDSLKTGIVAAHRIASLIHPHCCGRSVLNVLVLWQDIIGCPWCVALRNWPRLFGVLGHWSPGGVMLVLHHYKIAAACATSFACVMVMMWLDVVQTVAGVASGSAAGGCLGEHSTQYGLTLQ